MTTKMKTISVLMVAVFAIAASTFFITEQTYALEAKQGKNIIKEFQAEPTADEIEMQRLYEVYTSKESTYTEKQTALKKMEIIKDRIPKVPSMTMAEQVEIREHMNVLGPMMIQLGKQDIPINIVGIDYENKSLKIGLEKDGLIDAKIQESIKVIRNIVGNEIDITIQPSSKIVYAGSCSQTGDCEPIQGGVKIAVQNGLNCSMGIKASYDSKSGFVTAGHCNSSDIGGTGENVGNPTSSGGDVLGTVHANAFVNNTWCDCLFVDATETISANVFLDQSLSSTLFPVENDWVNMEGYASQGKTGQIKAIFEHFTATMPGTGDKYTTLGAVRISFTGSGGDSGGTVYEDVSSGTPKFAGIFSANNEDGPGSYYIPYYRITNAFSGLSFTYS